MATPFDVAWLVNGDEDHAPEPPARIIEELTMAGATPKNPKPRGGGRRPKDNPMSVLGWFITFAVPLLTAAFVTWIDTKRPKFWKNLSAKKKGVILMFVAAAAHYLEHMADSANSGGKPGDYDKEKALAMHDLGVACTTLAARYFVEAGAKTGGAGQADEADRKPDGAANEGVHQMVGRQLRQVVREVMQQQGQGAELAGFNKLAAPGLRDDLFAPDVLSALENLGQMRAA